MDNIERLKQFLLIHRTENIKKLSFEESLEFDNAFAEEIIKLFDTPTVIGRYLQEVNKKHPPKTENETNIIVLEGADLVVYSVWEEQRECSDWTELERIKLSDL